MPSFITRRLPVIFLVGSLIGIAAIILVPSWAPFLQRFEHQTADWRTSMFSDELAGPHPGVAVLLITDTTLQDQPYLLPPDRGLLARIVRALDATEPKAIGLDFYFTRRTEPAKDAELIAALREAKAPVVIGALDSRGKLGERQQQVQREFAKDTGRPSGFINLRTEPDGIVRFRAGPAADGEIPASFAEQVAAAAGATASEVEAPIAWLKAPGQASPAFLTLPAEALLPGTEANKAAAERGDIARLKGKAVLIGGDIAFLDRHATPLSGKGSGTPGVFVHAQDVAQRLDGRPMHEWQTSSVRIALLAVALAAAGLAGRSASGTSI